MTTLVMKKTSNSVPINSARYAASPLSCTLVSSSVSLVSSKRRQSTHNCLIELGSSPDETGCRAAGGRPRCSPASAGCGGDGAEPGAPKGATRRARFHPQRRPRGHLRGAGRGLLRRRRRRPARSRQPGESTDAPKLLAAGRTEFAILDIHDLGIARERGLDLVGVMPIVQRPLAAVIARGDGRVAAPARPRGPDGRRHRPALRRSGGRLRGQRRRRRPGRGRRGDDRLQRGRLARRRQGRRRDRLLERRGRGAAPPGRPDPRLQGRPTTAPRPTPSWS